MSLPSGYKRLNYIQSSGSQYIDTGFKPNQNTRVVMEMEFPTAPTSDRILCGVRAGSWGDRMFTITYVNSKSWWQFTYGSSYSTTSVTAAINTRFSVDQNKNVGTVNGVSSSAAANTFTSSLNAFIFCQNNGGSASNFSSFRLFRFSMYDNGTLVRDFIPCQKPDGTLGLWDDVNSVFYGNAGTGTFTAGPVVVVIPEAPSNFRLSSSTETTATLSWDAVDGATGYKLYRDGVLIATMTDTSYTDGIQPFTPYVYTLTAYNDNGESDPATISVQVIIPPETPSNFRVVSKSIMEISLAWDAVSGADSYQLKRDGTVVYTGEFLSYTDSGLTVDTAYTYTLSAVNTAGGSAEATLEAATTQFILVTDRTQADVTIGNAKGTYNASDLNRVGAAMNYVADRLRAAGYDPHISPKTDWKDGDWMDPAAQAVYLGDLAELRKQFTMLESTPRVPPRILATTINSGDGLTYDWANDIEQILMDIDDTLTRLQSSLFYSAELYSGEV